MVQDLRTIISSYCIKSLHYPSSDTQRHIWFTARDLRMLPSAHCYSENPNIGLPSNELTHPYIHLNSTLGQASSVLW